jgi:hypothetical protein
MPILGPRLEIADRLTFCEVTWSPDSPSNLQHCTYLAKGCTSLMQVRVSQIGFRIVTMPGAEKYLSIG